MNIAGIVILAIFFLSAVYGFRAGMTKMLSGVLSMILSCVLVYAALPYVTQILKTKTPVYEIIAEQCEKAVNTKAVSSFLSGKENSRIDRDQLRSLMEQYGIDTTGLDSMSEAEVRSLAVMYFEEFFPEAGDPDTIQALDRLSRIEQTKLIQKLPVPAFLQKMILNYNNSEGYRRLDVSDFGGYLVRFIANILTNILAFAATLIAAHLVIRIIMAALHLFSRLPVVSAADKIGGFALGAVRGIFLVWLLLLVLSVFSGTKFGIMAMEMVDQSLLARPLYQTNVFLKIVTESIKSIM